MEPAAVAEPPWYLLIPLVAIIWTLCLGVVIGCIALGLSLYKEWRQ